MNDEKTFVLGRDLGADEALMLARRATFDPGQFTKRILYSEDETETLERWQARAVLVALAADAPDPCWSSITGPHVTDYERAELARVLPDASLHPDAIEPLSADVFTSQRRGG